MNHVVWYTIRYGFPLYSRHASVRSPMFGPRIQASWDTCPLISRLMSRLISPDLVRSPCCDCPASWLSAVYEAIQIERVASRIVRRSPCGSRMSSYDDFEFFFSFYRSFHWALESTKEMSKTEEELFLNSSRRERQIFTCRPEKE